MCKPKITPVVLLKRKIKKTRRKNLSTVLQAKNNLLMNELEYNNTNRHSNLSYSMYLSPLNSSYQWTFRILVFTSFLDPATRPVASPHLTNKNFGQALMFPNGPKQFQYLECISCVVKCPHKLCQCDREESSEKLRQLNMVRYCRLKFTNIHMVFSGFSLRKSP